MLFIFFDIIRFTFSNRILAIMYLVYKLSDDQYFDLWMKSIIGLVLNLSYDIFLLYLLYQSECIMSSVYC